MSHVSSFRPDTTDTKQDVLLCVHQGCVLFVTLVLLCIVAAFLTTWLATATWQLVRVVWMGIRCGWAATWAGVAARRLRQLQAFRATTDKQA